MPRRWRGWVICPTQYGSWTTAMDHVGAPVPLVRPTGHAGHIGGKAHGSSRTPISPIMAGRSFRRHADVFDLSLETVKQAAKTWGGTINDVFVASVMRGLALYRGNTASCPGLSCPDAGERPHAE